MALPARDFLPALTVIAVGITAARLIWLRRLRHSFQDPLPGAFPYRRQSSLVTQNELLFYTSLRRAVGTRFTITVKVRLADVIACPRAAWSLGYGRLIAQKHLDFVVCDPKSLRVVLAIEVDDKSHERPARRLRDAFVNRAMDAAGVPLIRVRAASSYDPREIERLLSRLLGGRTRPYRRIAGEGGPS